MGCIGLLPRKPPNPFIIQEVSLSHERVPKGVWGPKP